MAKGFVQSAINDNFKKYGNIMPGKAVGPMGIKSPKKMFSGLKAASKIGAPKLK